MTPVTPPAVSFARCLHRLPLLLLLLVLALLVVPGCIEGSDGAEQTGGALITVTDAAADDIAVFEVDIVGFEFTKAAGGVVSALQKRTRVDFARLTDMDELLVGASLPAGIYTHGTMYLDFDTATIRLVDQPTEATILDADGTPLTGVVPVRVETDSGRRIRVRLLTRTALRLDLDLNATAQVDMPDNEVTITPVAIVRVEPGDNRPVNFTGLFNSADTGASTFELRKESTEGEVIGSFTVRGDAGTVYQVDGAAATGSSGLALLAGVSTSTRVVARGQLDLTTGELVADFVEAGAGVPGNGQDVVIGIVTSRTGGAGSDASFTVRASQAWDDGTVSYNRDITVNTEFAGTEVVLRTSSADFTTDAINVGQLVACYGDLTGDTMDCGGAATGVVRARVTDIYGLAAGAPTNDQLTIDLYRIRLRSVKVGGLFDWTGSNIDPVQLTVQLNGLSASTVQADTPVRIRGFFASPADAGAGADFQAISIVDRSDVATGLSVIWAGNGRNAGIASASASEVTFDISFTNLAVVDKGFVGVTNLASSPAPTIQPKADGFRIYVIVEGDTSRAFLDFGAFAAELAARKADGRLFKSVWAVGEYDEPNQTLRSNLAAVVLGN